MDEEREKERVRDRDRHRKKDRGKNWETERRRFFTCFVCYVHITVSIREGKIERGENG